MLSTDGCRSAVHFHQRLCASAGLVAGAHGSLPQAHHTHRHRGHQRRGERIAMYAPAAGRHTLRDQAQTCVEAWCRYVTCLGCPLSSAPVLQGVDAMWRNFVSVRCLYLLCLPYFGFCPFSAGARDLLPHLMPCRPRGFRRGRRVHVSAPNANCAMYGSVPSNALEICWLMCASTTVLLSATLKTPPSTMCMQVLARP